MVPCLRFCAFLRVFTAFLLRPFVPPAAGLSAPLPCCLRSSFRRGRLECRAFPKQEHLPFFWEGADGGAGDGTLDDVEAKDVVKLNLERVIFGVLGGAEDCAKREAGAEALDHTVADACDDEVDVAVFDEALDPFAEEDYLVALVKGEPWSRRVC